jgi:hypothetical protein
MKLTRFFEHQAVIRTAPINIPAVEKARAALAEARDSMAELRLTLLATLPPLDPEMPPTADEHDRRKRVLTDVDVLERGNWSSGIYDLRLTPFDGGPGINALDYWIRQADEAIEAERAKQAINWPAPHRYIGQPGTMTFDGRKLRRGDVVHLSRSQADAWADKFEMASEVEASGEAERVGAFTS